MRGVTASVPSSLSTLYNLILRRVVAPGDRPRSWQRVSDSRYMNRFTRAPLRVPSPYNVLSEHDAESFT